MKTFKEFQEILEGYKEPNIERMKKQAARHQSKADYSRGLHTLDTERKNIYKGKKNRDYGSNSPKGYYRSNYEKGEVRRGVDVNDLESINRFEKRQHKQNVEKPERRASNIRAKIKQHSNDPLGYMSKAFGGPHIDTGMDIKRRPKRKKVEEGYKEPNLEKMEKKAERHQFDANYKKDTYSMDDIKRNIYKGKRNRERDPNTPMYFRSPYLKGKPSRRVDANDLESVTRFEKRRHKQEIEPHERRASNIRAKVSQYKQDPLGYMSRSFGGPTIHPEGWKEARKNKK